MASTSEVGSPPTSGAVRGERSTRDPVGAEAGQVDPVDVAVGRHRREDGERVGAVSVRHSPGVSAEHAAVRRRCRGRAISVRGGLVARVHARAAARALVVGAVVVVVGARDEDVHVAVEAARSGSAWMASVVAVPISTETTATSATA